VTFTLKPGDPVIAIKSKPITPGGVGAQLADVEGRVAPPTKPKVEQQTHKTTTAQEGGEYVKTTQLEPSAAVKAKESRMWLYVAIAVIGLAVIAFIVALRMRRIQ
jgi:hypothetical protein